MIFGLPCTQKVSHSSFLLLLNARKDSKPKRKKTPGTTDVQHGLRKMAAVKSTTRTAPITLLNDFFFEKQYKSGAAQIAFIKPNNKRLI